MTATAEQTEATSVQSAPVSTNPYIGILGVFLGAATSTFNGRLLSIGLPDLRGTLGYGFDGASWIPTALNMGIMFTGVFGAFLGTAYGIRRVLLISGTVFTAASIALPFSPNLGAMVALAAIAGVAVGSFYTLTMSFVARALPPKLVLFGIAAYALDIVVNSHVATYIHGWYMDHLSWRWMFWTGATLMPVTMLCLYFGVPPAGQPERPNWTGFLYMSGGLSLIYGALDQGQRLDWWRSGVFTGMLLGGGVLILAAAVRRYLLPNRLVNPGFLMDRNVVMMGIGIFTIRISLLGSLVVIPSFLGNIARYQPIQTGATLAWIAAPQFLVVWIAAIAAVFIPPRIVMAAGFTTIAVGCWMGAHLDSVWAGKTFVTPELVIAIGVGVAFVSLVTNIIFYLLETGGVKSLTNTTTYSAFMHTMRIMGGQIGVVTLGHFITVREEFHSNMIGQYVDAGSWQVRNGFTALPHPLTPLSAGNDEAAARSAALLAGQVRAQAFTMAFSDAFLLIAWIIAAYLLLLVFLRPSTISLRHHGESTMIRKFLLVLCVAAIASAADSVTLTLPEAVRLALAQNRALKIARLKVSENEQKKASARSSYFPEIKNQSTVAHSTAQENIGIPAGAFGLLPNAGLVPNRDILINQGDQTFVTSGTMAAQPLTPLIRIHQANRIAASEIAASRDELKNAENEVAVKVHRVYYGILTARLQKLAAEQESAYSRVRLRESEQDVRNGNALKAAAIESQAGLLQSEQALLTVDLQLADLTAELNDLLGLPISTSLVLEPVAPVVLDIAPREEVLGLALAENPQIAAATEKVRQAKAALTAAKSAYIPDVSALCQTQLSEWRGVPDTQLRYFRRVPELRRVRFWQTPGSGSGA